MATYGYEQSKALILHSHGAPADVLKLHSYSISPPHSSLVTLRLLAAPINPADVNMIQGTYASLPPMTTALSTIEPAAVPGNEGVAEVVSAGAKAFVTDADVDADTSPNATRKGQEGGEGRRKYKKGDRVLFRRPHSGTFRTHLQLESFAIFPLPTPSDPTAKPLTNTQAATLSVNPVTAWALLRGQSTSSSSPSSNTTDPLAEAPREGSWIAQNAANSAVGRSVIQLAHAFNMKTINIIRSRPDSPETQGSGKEATDALKAELTSLGATAVVTEEEASEKSFPAHMKEITEGKGVEMAFNAVGGRSGLNLAKLLSTAPGGSRRHITYGAMARQPLTIPAGMLIFSDLHFHGFWVSKWGQQNPKLKERAIQEVVDLIATGRLKDAPVREVKWSWETGVEELRGAVEASVAGDGFREGKGVFVFERT